MDLVLEMPNLTTAMHTHEDAANEKGIALYATPGELSKSNYTYTAVVISSVIQHTKVHINMSS